MKREDDTEHGKRFVATMLARQGASQQELWEGYRCNLTHSLGINAPEPERGVARSTQPRLRPTKIVRADAGGLRRQQIDTLGDTSAARHGFRRRCGSD